MFKLINPIEPNNINKINLNNLNENYQVENIKKPQNKNDLYDLV